ncbi:MAG TPA: hypothetical protein VEQ87_09165 [Burkholderiales bacterium]|nr:hypothetical protein [Burkholderiales bacterium]
MRSCVLLLALALAQPAMPQDKPPAKKKPAAVKQAAHKKATPEQIRKFNDLEKKKTTPKK